MWISCLSQQLPKKKSARDFGLWVFMCVCVFDCRVQSRVLEEFTTYFNNECQTTQFDYSREGVLFFFLVLSHPKRYVLLKLAMSSLSTATTTKPHSSRLLNNLRYWPSQPSLLLLFLKRKFFSEIANFALGSFPFSFAFFCNIC